MTHAKPVIAFLPCRKGSQRVIEKNTRPFAGIQGGLLQVKLQQLADTQGIDEVVVSTNDPKVFDYAAQFAKGQTKRFTVLERPDELGSSTTSTDDVIRYVPSIIPTGVVLWTHVTSPFVTAAIYDRAIGEYWQRTADGTHDSLMGVTALRTFIWNQNGPVNYDRAIEKWPRTQTLAPAYEVNSSMFMIDAEQMRNMADRIGAKPYLFEIEHRDAFDIDWEEDFYLAEQLAQLRGRHP